MSGDWLLALSYHVLPELIPSSALFFSCGSSTLHQYRVCRSENRGVFAVQPFPGATGKLSPTTSAARRMAVKQVCFVAATSPSGQRSHERAVPNPVQAVPMAWKAKSSDPKIGDEWGTEVEQVEGADDQVTITGPHRYSSGQR